MMPVSSEKQHKLIVSVNRQTRIALSEDNIVYPIIAFYNDDHEQCEPEEAVTCVAGSDSIGWIALSLHDFTKTYMH